MKTKIKLQLSLPKPRNPVSLPARQRKAGVHESDNLAKHIRRVQKQLLRKMVSGRHSDDTMDL